MITVKFTGGARKSFDADEIILDKINLTVKQLIDHLISIKPENTAAFDGKNLLIAVNGIDSSALNGIETILNDNDVINIIPIIHGGSASRVQLKIFSTNIEIFEMKKTYSFDNTSLNNLRKRFPDLVVQAISSKFLLNKSHIKKIISLSLLAKKEKTMLSKKLETDILLRFAGTTQISGAIQNLGIRYNQNFLLIAMGKNTSLNNLHKRIFSHLTVPFSTTNVNTLKKYFKIYKNDLNTINSKTPLEDLLVEKASILI